MKSCELCGIKSVQLIIGNHYVCKKCKKELKLPKKETILRWDENNTIPWKKRKNLILKKLIRLDYIIASTNENK